MGKTISIISPCYNEEGNVALLIETVREVMSRIGNYQYEHIFADNKSQDETLAVLKNFAKEDKRIKIIANAANFGPTRSVFNALLAAQGDAAVLLAADLQDPPRYIIDFVREWENGHKIVFGLRANRQEGLILKNVRKVYYRLLNAISEDNLVNDAGDFVLLDKTVVEALRNVKTHNPYLRGLIASFGFPSAGIPYTMEKRHAGKSASVMSYFTYALNGFINHTLFPLRFITLLGIIMATISILYAFGQFMKVLLVGSMGPPGIPTLIVGLFGLMGINFFILGYLGEFIGSMFKQMKNLPLVIENERINFNGSD